MKSVAQCNGATAAVKKSISDVMSVVPWPSPMSVTFQKLCEAAVMWTLEALTTSAS